MGKIQLAFLPAWSAGHMTSMLEFAKRLLESTNNNFTITVHLIKIPFRPYSPATTSLIQSLTSSSLDIHFRDLPPIDPPLETDGPEDFISLFMQHHKHLIKEAISSSPSIPVSALFIDLFATSITDVANELGIPTYVSALFIDLFATSITDVANELGIPTYVYFTSTALMLGLMFHLPVLEENIDKEFEEVKEGIQLPGIGAIPGVSMPSPLMNKKSKNYTWLVYHGRRLREAKGVIVNTFEELEYETLRSLAEGMFVPEHRTPQIYPVGPVLSIGDADMEGSNRHECLKWLDEKPTASVVYLCFGSMGSFGAAQVKEMAAGLEQSGHRFLWIIRNPPTSTVRQLTDANLSELLPKGFLDRTRERGVVWPSWAPQAQILSHSAVGGFVTHCGWNSCLESLWFGVPMLAWPLYAEQHLNGVEMVRDLGVAVGLEVDRKNGNFVKGEELERGVRCLMGESDDGKRVRAKAQEMKLASRKAIEEGGSSYNYLEILAKELIG